MHKNSLKYKIKTNIGWRDFEGIAYKGKQFCFKIVLNDDTELVLTEDHKVYTSWFKSKTPKELKIGDIVITIRGIRRIKSVEPFETTDVYDIIDVKPNNRFFANGVLVHNCEFIGKSGTLVDSSVLRNLLDRAKQKKYLYTVDGDIRFYKNLDPTMKYIIGIDPAMGTMEDSATMQIFEFPTFEQVGEWKSVSDNQNNQVEKLKNLTDWMYKNLKNIGCKYPEIYWSLENNSVGEGFICCLREKSELAGLETESSYIKRAKLISEDGNKRMGFTTTKRTKAVACTQLKNRLENNTITINSQDYVQQLSNYTLKEANYAGAGTNVDDLIAASLIVIMVYIQEKQRLDLNLPIPTYNKLEHKTTEYESPFLMTFN